MLPMCGERAEQDNQGISPACLSAVADSGRQKITGGIVVAIELIRNCCYDWLSPYFEW